MMPLAPERNTMCVPAKPKADFSIDFIVGNNNNSKSVSNNNTSGSRSPPPARRSAMSPLSARQATPPHPYSRPTSPPSHGRGSPESTSVDDDDDLHIRARLFGLQGLQGLQQGASLPGAGALHPGLLHHHMSPMAREAPTSPTSTATPSPPHSPPAMPPFLLRGLYRPEPMMVPPQMQQMHPHLQAPPHLMHPHPHMGPHGPMPGLPKEAYPQQLYPWLLSRHGRMFPHRFPGVGGPDFAGFLLHPFRKPKRIRTAFSPSQLLKLEHAFENNHYVVGAERKQVAQALGLSETQVKVWFQNRRTKHKRTEQEEEAKQRGPSSKQDSANSSTSSTASWKDEASQRPVDLSSQDDSSEVESES